MLLEVKNLCKRYNKKIVLDDISFSVDKGKIVGLLGENGAGKTTLLKIIAGFSKPTSGQVLINNTRVGVETRRYVAFLPDSIMFPKWMKVKDALKFFVDFFDDFDLSRAKDMLEFLNISENGKIHDFSRGTIEKFSIALLLSRNTNLYLLDEPLAFVDPISRDVVINMILDNLSEDKTVIVSTNIISEIEHVFDEIIILKDGKIALIDSPENLREKSGVSVNQFFKEGGRR
ncbi:ABC transporter related protein [Caldicellulosiruptor kronotskyensis 2002]|uniref:ABC transporter related protein n=1 Tax=Caldicellulosiruptor kronotskyensis (strain DSM 18902 / VKM B-2412 / 2002) TaxID=632348 RepID=E4SD48_CALK2|nr:ATP-binding cassette domain-containing protein [Caldicellulosiruptor kronotskyensis]ADQ45112.1 ABC transporter related protein [Caldicellulosiruptor kronotskyensis 2002]